MNINIPNTCENTAKGAALVASLGYYKNADIHELSHSWQQYQSMYPNINKSYEKHYKIWVDEINKLKSKN